LIFLSDKLLLCLLAVAGMAQAADDSFAFTRNQEVLLMAPGATKPTLLGKGASAALSPSAKDVAYLSPDSRQGDTKTIALISSDRRVKRTLYTAGYPLRNLSWSKQGKLLFLVLKNGKEELHYLDPGASTASKPSTMIPKPAGADAIFSPKWCPDGQSVIFHDLSRVFRIDLSGRVLQKWTVKELTGRANSVDSLCSFSLCPANPKVMAYTSAVKGTAKFEEAMGGEPNTALFVIDLATKARKRLSPIDMVCADPVWSRDGNTIYLCGYREPHYRQAYPFRIYSIKPDGSRLTEICKGENPHP